MQNINSSDSNDLSVFQPMKKKLRSKRKLLNTEMLAEINLKIQSHFSGTNLLKKYEIKNYMKSINNIQLNTFSLKRQAKKIKDDLYNIYEELELFDNEISEEVFSADKRDILDCGISEDLAMLTRKNDLIPINIPTQVESQSLIFDTNMLSNQNFLNESAFPENYPSIDDCYMLQVLKKHDNANQEIYSGSQVIETQLENMKLDKKSGENRPSPMIISNQSSINETKNGAEVLTFLENDKPVDCRSQKMQELANQLPVSGSVQNQNDIKKNLTTNMSIDETCSSDRVNTKSGACSNRMDTDTYSSQMSVCFIEESPSETDKEMKTHLFKFKRNIDKINDKDVSSSTTSRAIRAKRICGEKQPKTILDSNSFKENSKDFHYKKPDFDSNSIDFGISDSIIPDSDENVENTDDLKFIKECEELSGSVKRFLNILKATRDDTELQKDVLKQISDIPNLKEPKKISQLEKFLTGLFHERLRIIKENMSMKTETLEDSYEEIDQLGLLYSDISATLYELYHNLKEEENENTREIFLNKVQDQLAKCFQPEGSLDPDFKDLLYCNYNQIEELRQVFLGSDEDLEEWAKNFHSKEESNGGGNSQKKFEFQDF